ncbi:hypothetical protein MUN76_15310 [Leucobacter rhizosphaerae]|uniref:Terminase n=1 Tax=Leucobacter rhizosphaerae TaxID=2932245 RepID=A0ABY4FVT6_9MICO|nr:hypothetical protein [Leucobacter rhizosphaerae]UOQ60377.1 hypothetical protein MUN76_15310 [Leucobacter rhizosphaerae]
MAGKKAAGPRFSSADARELWAEATSTYEMAAHERLILKGACTALDKIAALEDELDGASLMSKGSMGQDVANPLLGELRQTQAAFDRAMKQLALPDADGEDAGSSRSSSARAAAEARWGTGG